MAERKIDTGTVNIGIVYDEPEGRKGVVLLADRRLSLGSLGRPSPNSYKLRSISYNTSMTWCGSAGDAQWLADTVNTIMADNLDIYERAVKHFSGPPHLLRDEVDEILSRKFVKDVGSRKIKNMDEIGTTNYDAWLRKELDNALAEKQKYAEDFSTLREFMLETYFCKDTGQVKVRRPLPVEKKGFGGTKVYPAVGVAFQRRLKKNGKKEVLPTVDSTANLVSNIFQERAGSVECEGLIAGVDADGPKLFEIDERGSYIQVEIWKSTGSGSIHITTDMDRKSEELAKKKGRLTREDALWLALYGAIPVSTGTDNYAGPPLDMVVIEEDGKSGEIASYKVTVDLSVDKKNVVMPDVLEMEVLGGENAYYVARVRNDKNKSLASLKKVTGNRQGETGNIKSRVRDMARSYFRVLKKHHTSG